VLEKNQIRSKELATAFEWAKTDSRVEHWRKQGMILAFDIKPSSLKNLQAFPREMFAKSLSEGFSFDPLPILFM
jgi:adenosylmethionine-8-amino-7-oxononanoate aminotransferase